jgi:hypothetical protein
MSAPATIAATDAFDYFETERKKILEHKYLVSEKIGEDVGFERALKSWAEHHRAAWRAELLGTK